MATPVAFELMFVPCHSNCFPPAWRWSALGSVCEQVTSRSSSSHQNSFPIYPVQINTVAGISYFSNKGLAAYKLSAYPSSKVMATHLSGKEPSLRCCTNSDNR